MALLQQLTLWSSTLGDVIFGSKQSGAIGTTFGAGAATAGSNAQNSLQMGTSGDINVQQVSAGRSPGSTGSDIVLATYTLPAGALDVAGRLLDIQAQGSVLNGTSKVLKIIWGATTATVGSAVTGGTAVASMTTTAAGGWQLMASVSKYGAAGSNTQLATHQAAQAGATVLALVAPSLLTSPENAPIIIAITGNAATTATDIVFNFLQISGSN